MTNQELERLQKGRELILDIDVVDSEIKCLQSLLNRTKEGSGYKLKLYVRLLDEYSTIIENAIIDSNTEYIKNILQSKIDEMIKLRSLLQSPFDQL